MYSKTIAIAIAALLTGSGCSINLPWANEPIREEVSLSFVIRNNLLFLSSATIDGRSGQFLIGVAQERTVLDNRFAASLPPASGRGGRVLQLGQKEALHVTPIALDLRSVADGIIGADAWSNRAISLDYTSGLLTYQKEGIHPELMTIYRFSAEPRVTVIVDGKPVEAIVDTTSPDTLTLPRLNEPTRRTHARVQLAGADLGNLDIRFADVSEPRAGNRILSRFLVTIDYGKHEVGLWRDPRTL